MSLRLSLIISIGLVMLITLLFGSLAMYVRAIAKVETEVVGALQVAVRNAENQVSNFNQDPSTIRRFALLVSNYNGHRHVRASFQSTSGNLNFESQPQRTEKLAPDWFSGLFWDASRQVSIKLPDAIAEFGKLTLASDPQNEIDEVWSYLSESLFLLAALCLSVPLLIYWQLSRSLKPLEELSRAFAEVGPESRPAPVLEKGPLELRQVYRGYNQMVEGLALAEHNNQRLNEQLTTVQDEERADLARDLHDEIGPFLFAVDVETAAIKRLPAAKDNDAITTHVASIRDSVKHMQGIVKSLLGRLRPGVLLDQGLTPAVENLVNFWRGRHPGIHINSNLEVDDLGEALNGTIYRIVQESLSNSIRHGQPTNIEITLTNADDNHVHLVIMDDGIGSEILNHNTSHGFGIRGMRERVQNMGGRFKVMNRMDRSGVRVDGVIPIQQPAQKKNLEVRQPELIKEP